MMLIIGNWKMNGTDAKAIDLAREIVWQIPTDGLKGAELVLCPPFTALSSVRRTLDCIDTAISLGAQDVFWRREGAFTGAISAMMLKELGCSYCIVGHSERREHFGETDVVVNLKTRALLAAGITPIICCGESIEARESGQALNFVATQIRAAFMKLPAEHARRTVVGYEPTGAIGTGRTPAPEQVEEVCAHLYGVLADKYGVDIAGQIPILYGGSGNPDNAASFATCPHVGGLLLGGTALDAKKFVDTARAFANQKGVKR